MQKGRPTFVVLWVLVLAAALAACGDEKSHGSKEDAADTSGGDVAPDTGVTPADVTPDTGVTPADATPDTGVTPADVTPDTDVTPADVTPDTDVTPADVTPDIVTCTLPEIDCDGVCTNTDLDASHCGSCGTVCGAGESCVAGQCGCQSNETYCEGVGCVDSTTDPDHCGTCAMACKTGADCISGQCVCPSGTTDCGNECADLSSSVANCGGCGYSCDPSFGYCNDGRCECNNGLYPIRGQTTHCVEAREDPIHCGGAGIVCWHHSICSNHTCVCRPGLDWCGVPYAGGACVDLQSDPHNCGACGTDCGNLNCYQGQCSATACDMQQPTAEACDFNQQSCVLTDDLQTNPLHCGACGQICAVNEVCTNGACRPYRIGRACTACPCDDCTGDFVNCEVRSDGAVICSG